ncbi:MAG: hypothetical protein IT462_14925 [Planctomycetes bacterium]|nr:hypothetical protein [Planctomycetota bacterium]
MKLRSLFAAIALILGVAVPAFAGEAVVERDSKETPKEEPKAEEKKSQDFEALLKEVDKVVTLNFTADDVKFFNDNWVEITKALSADEKFRKLKDENVKTCFDYAVTVEAFKKWATDKKVDADATLRKGMRIVLQHLKLGVDAQLKMGRAWIEAQRKAAESKKETMGEEKYKKTIAALDEQTKTMDGAEKGFKLVPDPTEAEKKLLEDDSDAIGETVATAQQAAAEFDAKKEGAKEGTKDGMK